MVDFHDLFGDDGFEGLFLCQFTLLSFMRRGGWGTHIVSVGKGRESVLRHGCCLAEAVKYSVDLGS